MRNDGQSQAPALSTGRPFGALIWCAMIVLLVMFSEGFLPRLFASEQEAEGSSILRLMWFPAYGVILLLALARWQAVIKAIGRVPFLVLLLMLCAATTMWSIEPSITLRRAVAILFTTLFGIVMASHYSWRDMLRLLGLTWAILAVISLFTSILLPGFGTMTEVHVGAWRGMWWEKNSLGGHMGRAGFLFAVLIFADRPYRKAWGAAFVLACFLVLMSTSKTAALGLALGIGVLGMGLIIQRGTRIALVSIWFAATIGGAMVMSLVLAPEFVFGLFGREPTLTGRTDIWGALAYIISERPLLGYGYGAFWGPHSAPAYWVWVAVEWAAPTAHNGWLEIWLGVGLVGLLFFLANFVLTIYRAIIAAFHGWPGLFATGYLLQFLMFSMSESIIFQQNAIIWVTYVGISVRLAIDRA